MQSGFDNRLAITGRKHASNLRGRRQLAVEVANLIDDDFKRRTFVGAVIRIKNLFIVADSANLCRGGAGVNANVNLPVISAQVAALNLSFVMPGFEGVIVSGVLE